MGYTICMINNQIKTGVAVAAAMAVVGLFFIFNDPFSVLSSAVPATEQILIVQDETVGAGAVATTGDRVEVHYTAKLEDGTVIDTSIGGAPDQFVLGAGTRILGWEQGIAGMRVGGKRLLIVPPTLGYGETDYGPIPGNSTLVFEVELVSVEKQ